MMRRLLRLTAVLLDQGALVPLAVVVVGAGLTYLTGYHAQLAKTAEALTADIKGKTAELAQLVDAVDNGHASYSPNGAAPAPALVDAVE